MRKNTFYLIAELSNLERNVPELWVQFPTNSSDSCAKKKERLVLEGILIDILFNRSDSTRYDLTVTN